jgi:hypothetical protein
MSVRATRVIDEPTRDGGRAGAQCLTASKGGARLRAGANEMRAGELE